MRVFQSLRLHQSAQSRSEAVEQGVGELAHLLSLKAKLTRPIEQLAGGEWQRVRLAVAMFDGG